MAAEDTRTAPKARGPGRRLTAIAGIVLAALVVMLVVVRFAAGGPIGRAVLASNLDGRTLGALGTLEVEGLAGDPLRDLRIARLAIADDQGVWFEAEDIELRWRPLALLGRTLSIEELGARRISLARRPPAGEGGGEGGAGGATSLGIALDALHLPRVELGEPVLGAEAVLSADATLSAARSGALAANVDVRRTDAPGDVLTVQASRDAAGRLDVEADVLAPAQGPLARLMRLPSQTIRAQAAVTGDAQAGQGTLVATLDDAPFIDASGDWRDDAGAGRAQLRLAAAPELAALAERLGDDVSLDLDLGARARDVRPLRLEARADGLDATAQGGVDLARRTAPQGLAVTVTAPRLDRLIGAGALGGATLGAGTIDGRVTFDDGAAYAGPVEVDDVSYGAWRAARLGGDVTVGFSAGRLSVEGGLGAEGFAGPATVAPVIGPTPQLAATASYDVEARRLSASSWALTAAAGEARGDADVSLAGGPMTAHATLALADLSAAPQLTAGTAALDATVSRVSADQPIHVTLSGSGADLAASTPALADLLGATAALDLDAEMSGRDVQISRATLETAGLMLEVQGGASPATGYDLALDAALKGPVEAGPVVFAGAATAAARLEGRFNAPRLRLDARASAFTAGPVEMRNPRLRAELADLTSAPSGTIAFDADTDDGPAALSAEVSYRDGTFAARSINGGWRGFEVTGHASRPAAGAPEGVISVSGLEGRLSGEVALTLTDGPPRLDLQASLENQPIADAGVLTALDLTVVGPLDALDVTTSANGFAGARFMLAATGRIERDDKETRLSFDPSGTLASEPITAPEPWTLVLGASGDAHAAAQLAIDGGTFEARLDRADGRTELAADLDNAPLALVNLVRPDPRLEGHADAHVALSGTDMLSGEIRLAVTDARAPDYVADGGVDLTVTLAQAADGADVAVSADAEGDFSARADGRAPLTIAAWPPLPRLDRAAPVSLMGQAHGDVAPLWAVAGLPVIALSGDLDATGSLTGSLEAPTFGGAAQLANGRLEEARIGLTLADLQGSARLDGPRLVVDHIEASDGGEGRVTGSGEVEFGGAPGSETHARLELTRLQAVRTGQDSVVASGQAAFVRDADGAVLSGDLTVDQADVTPPRGGGGAVTPPTLEVEEINRPESLAPPPSRAEALKLDLKLAADRRVFIRTTSIDTEWMFDLAITGDTAAPQLNGTATLVRGDLTLAGERFAFDDAKITFDGKAADAKLDLAARRATGDISVVVHITGTADRPEVHLSSTPSYPEDEILSRVLFGRATSDLSALEAAQLASALSQLAGGGGFDLLGPLRETLGVDRLSVGTGANGGALVSGGRYISDDVYLEVTSTPTGLAQAAIEWEIRPRLELVSRFGLGRDTAVSLRWRKDY